jgi:hypothetical protein
MHGETVKFNCLPVGYKKFRVIIFPAVFCWCETWCLIRKERDLLLKEKFGPKREEITGDFEINKDDLHDLYSAPNTIRVVKLRRMKRVVHVESMGERRIACRILVE